MAGLGARLTPRGSGFAPLMLKNRSGMNHHKESAWGGGGGGRVRRREKRKKKVKGMMGTQGDREVRGCWILSTEGPQSLGVQGLILDHCSSHPYNCHQGI